jgi:hypothetical protein
LAKLAAFPFLSVSDTVPVVVAVHLIPSGVLVDTTSLAPGKVNGFDWARARRGRRERRRRRWW